MEDWPRAKKKRISEIVRGLGLPPEGRALDFGCGHGVFTEVLRQALPPGWLACGLDVSATAVESARQRHPLCRFFLPGEDGPDGAAFDLVFTHHVLEHVPDLEAALDEACLRAADGATILHVLPCGNEGSLERRLCALRRDGIDPGQENRFFFEDEAHLRRLGSGELVRRMAERGFALKNEYYSGQLFGALNWITLGEWGFLRRICDTTAAVDRPARRKLAWLGRGLTLLKALRFPAQSMERKLRKSGKTPRDVLILLGELPLYLPSKLVDAALRRLAQREWRRRRTDRGGSEMYLIFSRDRARFARPSGGPRS